MKERTRKKSYTIKEESGVAGISVKFNITEYTDGGFRIRGTLVEGKNDIPVDNVLPLVRYGNSHKELPTKKNHLTRALLDKLPVRSTGTRTTRVKPSTGAFTDAFQNLLQKLQNDPKSKYRPETGFVKVYFLRFEKP